MSFLYRKCQWGLFNSCLRLYSLSGRSHYDVLRLHRNCSDRDIKEAYFKLSKEYHPDMNKEMGAKEQFVKISEAYNVLGKPSSRAQYDRLTFIPHSGSAYYRSPQAYYTHAYHHPHETPEYTQAQEEPKPHTVVDKQTRLFTNQAIVALCFTFALVGIVVQMFIIRESFLRNRRIEIEKTKKNAAELAKVQATAQENGNELQTKLMLERIVQSAQAPAATAALARALATGQKEEIDVLLQNLGLTTSYVGEDYEGITYHYLRNLFKFIN